MDSRVVLLEVLENRNMIVQSYLENLILDISFSIILFLTSFNILCSL